MGTDGCCSGLGEGRTRMVTASSAAASGETCCWLLWSLGRVSWPFRQLSAISCWAFGHRGKAKGKARLSRPSGSSARCRKGCGTTEPWNP